MGQESAQLKDATTFRKAARHLHISEKAVRKFATENGLVIPWPSPTDKKRQRVRVSDLERRIMMNRGKETAIAIDIDKKFLRRRRQRRLIAVVPLPEVKF